MEITGLTGPQHPNKIGEGKNKPSSESEKHKLFSSIAAKYEHVEISAKASVYNQKGEKLEIKIDYKSDEITIAETVTIRREIHNEIMEQVKISLRSFFEENPEAVEQVSKGEIPNHFNVENTARRILDIYFSRYKEGDNKADFAARAKEIINTAYAQVQEMIGDLPEIVLETQKKVMNILDKFSHGEDISDFIESKISGENNGK